MTPSEEESRKIRKHVEFLHTLSTEELEKRRKEASTRAYVIMIDSVLYERKFPEKEPKPQIRI